jgi:hypothetical protein
MYCTVLQYNMGGCIELADSEILQINFLEFLYQALIRA